MLLLNDKDPVKSNDSKHLSRAYYVSGIFFKLVIHINLSKLHGSTLDMFAIILFSYFSSTK